MPTERERHPGADYVNREPLTIEPGHALEQLDELCALLDDEYGEVDRHWALGYALSYALAAVLRRRPEEDAGRVVTDPEEDPDEVA